MSMLRPAVLGIALFAIVCTVLVGLWAYMPSLEMRWYPAIWVRMAAISPLLFAGRMAPIVYRVLRQPMSGKDRIAFAGTLCVGVGLVAVLTEAALVMVSFGALEGLGFFEVLFQPLTTRYTLEVIAGLGFASCALLVAGFVGFLSVPIRVLSLHQHAQAAPPRS